MDPCRQEPRLNHIEGHIAEMVRETRDEQRETRKLLEELVRQSGRIESLEKDVLRQENLNTEIFKRLNSIERQPAKVAGKVFWVSVTAVVGCLSGIISGMSVWLLTGG